MQAPEIPADSALALEAPTEAMPSNAVRILAGIVLSAIAGACLFFSFPRQGGIWPLVFIGFIPMYIAQYRVFPRRWSGLAVGIVFFSWWYAALLTSSSLVPIPKIIGGALVFGIIGGVIGIFLRPFTDRTGYRWFLVSLPLVWVAFDLITTNDWLGTEQYIAYHLAPMPQIIQPVSIVSTLVLNFVIVVFNAALSLALIALMDRHWPQLADVRVPDKVLKWSSIIAGAVTVVWLASSFFIYNQVTASMGPTVRIAAVIPGLENYQKSLLQKTTTGPPRTPAEIDAALQTELTEMTRDAAKQGAQLVVWPEETLHYDPRVTNTEWIPKLATDSNVYIVTGFTTDMVHQNVAIMFGPGVGDMGTYNKVHRVLAEGEAFPPGTTFPTFQTSVGPIGVIICWDMDFPDSSARLVTLTGSEIVVVPSVDFASISESRLGSNVFRAVENRVGVVKSDRAWDSRMVQPNGQVVGRAVFTDTIGGKDLLIADVARGPRDAPFTQLGGQPFAFLLTVALVGMVITMVITSRRTRRAAAIKKAENSAPETPVDA